MPVTLAVATDSLLYADDTCIVFQYKNVTGIEKQPLRDFSSLCDWFVDNKLANKFKCTFWPRKNKINSIW